MGGENGNGIPWVWSLLHPLPPTYLPEVNEYGRNTQTSNIDPISLSAHTRKRNEATKKAQPFILHADIAKQNASRRIY